MTDSMGSAAQVRIIADQVAEAAITKFYAEHPPKAELPSPLKWAGIIMAGVFTTGLGAMAVWLVSTVSDMQVTLARLDERMASGAVKDSRYEELDRRVTTLETFHRGDGK